jgi:hypothetical protein
LQPSQEPTAEFGEVAFNLTTPANLTVQEDRQVSLGTLVEYVDRIPREDEALFLEVVNYPPGTTFYNGNQEITSVVNGTILIPVEGLSNLQVQGPLDFSGIFSFDIQATLREGVDLEATPEEYGIAVVRSDTLQTITVEVEPLAELIRPEVFVLEDQEGVIELGSMLVGQQLLQDDGSSPGNNIETETFTEIRVEVPNATASFVATLEGSFASFVGVDRTEVNGNAEVLYEESDEGIKTFTIRSLQLPDGSRASDDQLLALSQTEREQVSADILAVFELLELSLGPEHTDDDGELTIRFSLADVNPAVIDRPVSAVNRVTTPLRVVAIADTPAVQVESPAATVILEDDGAIPLFINVTNSADRDNSEVLSVEIIIPQDFLGPIGEIQYIAGNLPDGMSLELIDVGVWRIEAEADTVDSREAFLNSALNTGEFGFVPRNGWAEIDSLIVQAVSTEQATGFGQVLEGFREARANATLSIEVIPVADEPTVEVKGNALGREDVSDMAVRRTDDDSSRRCGG